MKLYIPIEIDEEDFAAHTLSLSHDAVIDLVRKIDSAHADVGFTEELIRMLVASLMADVGPDGKDCSLPFIDWSKVA